MFQHSQTKITMIRTPSSIRQLMLLVALSSHSMAITLVPSWDGAPLSTFTSYKFTTDSRTAPPEEFTNSHVTPTLLVEDEQFFGTGWQDPDPDVEFQLVREPTSGTWDLGQAGKMSIMIPISKPLDISPKDLEIFVDMIWYFGPVNTPTFAAAQASPIFQSFESELVAPDGAGSWRRTVWQATFEDYIADSITLEFQSPSNGSVIDSVKIYTLIPEPSGAALVVLAFGVFAAMRRR
jgi:hypothetical protein